MLSLTRACATPVIIADGTTWTGEELSRIWLSPSLQSAASCEAVALCLKDPAKLALALIALHGRVSRMFLVSHDTPGPEIAELSRLFEPDLVLTDRPDVFRGWEHPVSVWDRLDPVRGETSSSGPPPERPTEWVLATSGTTGSRKLVAHRLSSLARTVKRPREGERALRWGQVYNLCRFAGVQVFLQALMGGGTLLLPDPDWPLGRQIDFLARHGCTALSATPTLWRKILMSPESQALEPVQITLGGEIVDDAILRSLTKRYPAARIVHIYASTEAGAAFAVKDGRMGFPTSYLEAAPDGVRIKIEDGRLFVHNADVRRDYLGERRSFVDAEGFVDTGDRVETRGDRCYFLGRSNGMINVGGNKLFPEEVEQVLLSHPSVHAARIRAKSSPITGQLVIADVVPVPGAAGQGDLPAQLAAHCRSRLERWKVPASIRLVQDVETNAGGKLGRAQP